MVEKRENSLWLFNQPVVALGVVCLCSTASNKWISHWQTDVGKKDSAYKSLSLPFQTAASVRKIQNASSAGRSVSFSRLFNVYFHPGLLYGTNTDSLLLLYSRYIVFVWTLYCLLHVNGLLTMYGVMRPWVQGQLWYMRVKIGLCCTDDLISIFRDLGMEMTLFTFKCFVLAPGLLYLCLIPVRRHEPARCMERAHWPVRTPPNYNRSLQTQQGVHPHNHQAACTEREKERESESVWLDLGVTFIFSVQLTWCMHSRK